MEFILHINVFGIVFTKEFFDSNQNLTCLSQFWLNHKDIVSHVTICRYGKYVATVVDYDEFKSYVSNIE